MFIEMLEEIRQLEVETFEIEDLADARVDLGIQVCQDGCAACAATTMTSTSTCSS